MLTKWWQSLKEAWIMKSVDDWREVLLSSTSTKEISHNIKATRDKIENFFKRIFWRFPIKKFWKKCLSFSSINLNSLTFCNHLCKHLCNHLCTPLLKEEKVKIFLSVIFLFLLLHQLKCGYKLNIKLNCKMRIQKSFGDKNNGGKRLFVSFKFWASRPSKFRTLNSFSIFSLSVRDFP